MTTPNPSLRELIAKPQFDKSASRMAGLELREIIYVQKEYRDRLTPATMLAVLGAIEDAISKINDAAAGKINFRDDFAYRLELALKLLNSQP